MTDVIRLPIYEEYLPSPTVVELEPRIDRDSFPVSGVTEKGRACDRCKLGQRQGLRNTCIRAEGRAGGLLVIGEGPGQTEDAVGRPFVGKSGQLLRKTVESWWSGPVAYDNATRCSPGKIKLTDKMINQCRGFLSQTIDEVRPTRIICVGAWAAKAVFGRSVSPFSTRGGYAYLRGYGKPTPVFFVLHPAAALRNRFVRGWFAEDMRKALTDPDPPPGPWDVELTVVNNVKLAEYAERSLRTNRWVSFDVETYGIMWNKEFRMISVALTGSDDDEVFVWDKAGLEDPEVCAPLLRLLQDRRVKKMGQNVKYDQLAFRAAYGISVRPIVIDTRLQRKLLEPEAEGGLGKMAELVGMGGLKEEASEIMDSMVRRVKAALREKTPEAQAAAMAKINLPEDIEAAFRLGVPLASLKFGLIPYDTLTRYNARDSVATKLLGLRMEKEIKAEPRLQRMWTTQIVGAAEALERVEAWGVPASKQAIRQFDRFLEMREVGLKTTLDQYGPTVNWNAPDQVGELLFKQLRLPPLKSTPGGKLSTDSEVLKHLAGKHPLPKALLDYRFVSKLRGTYAQGMFPHVRSDGRIHPNLKIDGTRTGRLSCGDPNLQNIPRADSPEGKMARDCFVASPGCLLLEADYAQIELRVAAMLSQDSKMLEIFASGVDYHMKTAQLISKIAWGINPDQVEDKHRSLAKSVVFGTLYGKTAHTFAKEWGVSKAKAQVIVDAIMGQFKRLKAWTAERQTEASKTGYVWTWWAGQPARRRSLWQIADADDARASVARNGAGNTPIQGTANEFCLASLRQCVEWIESDGIEDMIKLVLAVHDSLMFEVRRDMVEEAMAQVHSIMTSHDSMNVKLVADFKVGASWGSMVKIKPGQKLDSVLEAS